MLKDTQLSADFSFEALVEISGSLSGSDLKELCRNAAMIPVREYMRQHVDIEGGFDRDTISVRISSLPFCPCVVLNFLHRT